MESNPLLVSAGDLDSWADTEDAKGAFPELMRRLLAQTPGVSNINIRAHEGTAAPGWDGTATSAGSAYLPAGELRFEFGTNQDPKRKANEDYEKRAKEAAGTTDEIYLFATPRNWAGAAAWAEERRNEKIYESVEAFDAHRLEGWLQSVPAVHYWISERLGKHPADVRTLASWWEGFLGRARVEVPPKFHTAGRDKEKQRTLQLLKEKAPFLTVQSTWRDDALAFCHAALKEGDPAALDKTVVVWSAQAWRQLAVHSSPMILVPLFDNPDIGLANSSGHAIVHVVDKSSITICSSSAIQLPVISSDAGASTLLRETGVRWSEAEFLAEIAHESMDAFYRHVSQIPTKIPTWAKSKEAAHILAPLVLVGGWEDANSADSQAISNFVGLPYDKIKDYLTNMKIEYPSDPPFAECRGEWKLVSPFESAKILLPKLREPELERWGRLVHSVLLADDSSEWASSSELNLVQHDRVPSPASSLLCRSIARSLAVSAVTCEKVDVPRMAEGGYVREIVEGLLNAAFQDQTGRVFISLAPYFPFLAESSPEVFVRQLEDDLVKSDPVSMCIFRVQVSSGQYSTLPFRDLICSLEYLCGSVEFYNRAARLLVKLADMDSESKKVARCFLESVESVIAVRYMSSLCPLDDGSSVLEWAVENCPGVGWLLVRTVLSGAWFPCFPDTSIVRDWRVSNLGGSVRERSDYVHILTQLAVRNAERDANGWWYLLSALGRIPEPDQLMVVEAFRKSVRQQSWDSENALKIWLSVNEIVRCWRCNPGDGMCISPQVLEVLKCLIPDLDPGDHALKYQYLFDVTFNAAVTDSVESLREEQRSAAIAVVQQGSEQLRTLVSNVQFPEALGNSLADIGAEFESLVLESLTGDSPAFGRVLSAYIKRKVNRQGAPWVRRILDSDYMTIEEKGRFVAALPSGKDFRDVVNDFFTSLL